MFLILLVSPAFAHKVQVAEDIGGTLHIEPDDRPQAGKAALTWIALTRAGGQIVPLEHCNCELSVYRQPDAEGASPVLEPELQAISVERYEGVPAAEITFPEVGAYLLKLNGTPTSGAEFQPFQLEFTVDVRAGTPLPEASPQALEPTAGSESVVTESTQQSISKNHWGLGAIAFVLLLGAIAVQRLKQKH